MVLGHAALFTPGASGASRSPLGIGGVGEGTRHGEEEEGRQRVLCRHSLDLLAARMGYRGREEYLAFLMQVSLTKNGTNTRGKAIELASSYSPSCAFSPYSSSLSIASAGHCVQVVVPGPHA